jgi:hypothetical protein
MEWARSDQCRERLLNMCESLPEATTRAGGDQEALVGSDSRRFFVPPYLGHRGWVGLWLDRGRLDWVETAELFVDAYRRHCPSRRERGSWSTLDGSR